MVKLMFVFRVLDEEQTFGARTTAVCIVNDQTDLKDPVAEFKMLVSKTLILTV